MITIISGTNRENSNSQKVSESCLQILKEQGYTAQICSLTALPDDFFSNRKQVEIINNLYLENSFEHDIFIKKNSKSRIILMTTKAKKSYHKFKFKNKGRIFIQKQTVKKSLNLLLKFIK